MGALRTSRHAGAAATCVREHGSNARHRMQTYPCMHGSVCVKWQVRARSHVHKLGACTTKRTPACFAVAGRRSNPTTPHQAAPHAKCSWLQRRWPSPLAQQPSGNNDKRHWHWHGQLLHGGRKPGLPHLKTQALPPSSPAPCCSSMPLLLTPPITTSSSAPHRAMDCPLASSTRAPSGQRAAASEEQACRVCRTGQGEVWACKR